VFENRVLKRIFGPKKNEVKRGRRKLQNEKHHNKLLGVIATTKSKRERERERWAGLVARMGEKRNAFRLFLGKPEGRRTI
jgi:hypothetical protein